MALRFSGFLIPSVLTHGAMFVALASDPVQTAMNQPREIDVIEFVAVTEHGGGRLGNDTQIGDAAEPTKAPEKIFRQVKPKRRPEPTATIETASPEEPTPEAPAEDSGGAPTAHGVGDPGASGGGSLVSGSAGTNPNATGAGVGSGPGVGVDRRTALRAWLREVQREANKIASRNYPSAAVRQGIEGKLRLGIRIGEDGGIRGVRVMTSSGHPILDDAAQQAVMRLRIPPPPEALQWREREVALPVRFALE